MGNSLLELVKGNLLLALIIGGLLLYFKKLIVKLIGLAALAAVGIAATKPASIDPTNPSYPVVMWAEQNPIITWIAGGLFVILMLWLSSKLPKKKEKK